MTRFALTLPWPPSVNGYWRAVRGRQILSKRGREYRLAVQAVCETCGAADHGLDERLAVDITAYPPDRRKRDLDNLPKSLLDGLTHAGVWVDDEQIDTLTIRRGPVEAGGRVVVSIAELLP